MEPVRKEVDIMRRKGNGETAKEIVNNNEDVQVMNSSYLGVIKVGNLVHIAQGIYQNYFLGIPSRYSQNRCRSLFLRHRKKNSPERSPLCPHPLSK